MNIHYLMKRKERRSRIMAMTMKQMMERTTKILVMHYWLRVPSQVAPQKIPLKTAVQIRMARTRPMQMMTQTVMESATQGKNHKAILMKRTQLHTNESLRHRSMRHRWRRGHRRERQRRRRERQRRRRMPKQ